MTQALPGGKGKLVTPYRIVVSALLALAAAMLYVGTISSVDRKTDEERDQRVVSLSPAPDELALRQDRIFVQLDQSYTGILVVDGYEIPLDQLDYSEGLNTVGYTPGPGTETGALKPGERCATVVYWVQTSTREASAQNYSWCWSVH